MVIQSSLSEITRKARFLSLVAFRRLSEADLGSARNRSKLPVLMDLLNGRTAVTSDIERLEGMRTFPHQRHRQ